MINQWSASFRFGLHLLPFRIGLESSPIFLRFLPAGMLQNVDEQGLRIRRILGRPVTHAESVFRNALEVSACIGASTTPGATVLSRMCTFAYSRARHSMSAFRPHLVIIETEASTPAIRLSASAALMLTMLPPLFCTC